MIVGRIAATRHGATRVTADLDICPRWDRENLERVAAVLTEADARIAITATESVPVPLIDGVLIERTEIGTWHTRLGGLDILRGIPRTATETVGYTELLPHAQTTTIAGHTVYIASLDAVILSKQIAGRPKDREALPELKAIAARRLADAGHPTTAHDTPGPAPRAAKPGSRNRLSSNSATDYAAGLDELERGGRPLGTGGAVDHPEVGTCTLRPPAADHNPSARLSLAGSAHYAW